MKTPNWGQIIVINVTILTFAAYVVIQGSLKNPTRTTSSAAPVIPTISPIPQYPASPPLITQVEYWFGKPGDQIRLRGNHFGAHPWQSTLAIGQVPIPQSSITAWSDKVIDLTLPNTGISSNLLYLTVNGQTAVGPVLSVYHSTSDPRLQFTPTESGSRLNLINAPLGSPLTLTINQNTYNLTPNSSSTPVALFPQKITIQTASLKENSGTYLPLYQHPLDLLP